MVQVLYINLVKVALLAIGADYVAYLESQSVGLKFISIKTSNKRTFNRHNIPRYFLMHQHHTEMLRPAIPINGFINRVDMQIAKDMLFSKT